jgi:hypothetical protein
MEEVTCMGKRFLKLMAETPRSAKIILIVGILLSGILGITAYQRRALENGYELERRELSEGDYREEVIAYLRKEKIPVTVTVDARMLSEEEAEEQFLKSEVLLLERLRGENESLSLVTKDLDFISWIPETGIEVEWVEKQLDYFYSDGKIRENQGQSEIVELQLSAIMICQEYTKELAIKITVLPTTADVSKDLLKLIESENETTRSGSSFLLPKEFQGQTITWKRPMDHTWMYVLLLTLVASIALVCGVRIDQRAEKKRRVEELEKDYAQIVSKFTMLLSAGLSVRNAWERIVIMQRRKGISEKIIDEELRWGLREMQKGIPEMSVYERFGQRVGEVHFKKLMALFISDKKRGTLPLLDAMNQEMLCAWEEQKRKTRQQGEKIGTKLLLPMMGMLSVVFLIVLIPAFLSFGG